MKGNISVQTGNIFPIIKKFLYSDQEIFLRELIANATDATSKLKTYASRGEMTGELGDLTIEIILDAEAKTLTIRDKGIGMTEDEVKRYLAEVALSSAQEFVEKYQGETNIIGHFGLGFYSAFMVADKVEVITKSWKDAPAVSWTCMGEPEYELEVVEKTARGTDIVLHISEDSKEYLEQSRIAELLEKYCKFLPVEIQFGERTITQTEGEGDDKKVVDVSVPNIINNPSPIWKKNPLELTKEDYVNFYQELYPNSPEPLFWIHLNIDYPFNLTGVMYFPREVKSYELQKNKISLYSNQVFVTDNVKEIVPEFLMLLHGIIDSPDIPLNVSRSYLQSDRNVKRITEYITRKVADKLDEMFRTERESFEDKWSSMDVFVKYGMITEDKFYDKAKKFFLFENTDEKLATIEEYREKIAPTQTDKDGKVVHIYASNLVEQDHYIQAAKNLGYDVLLLDHPIDAHFLNKIEYNLENTSFVRIDADTAQNLIKKDEVRESVLSADEQSTLTTLFQSQMTDTAGRVELQPLSPTDAPVVITIPEFMRRMKEMYAMQGENANFPDSYNVVVNSNHPVFVNKILKTENETQKADMVKHLYDLARLQQNMLKGADLSAFINKSVELM